MITNEELDALERRYLPADQQKCIVCGAPLTFAASGNDGRGWSKYACSSDAVKPGPRPGLHDRLEHYDRSTWYDRSQADMAVVELVRAYRAQLGNLVRWAPYQEFGIPDPGAETMEAPDGLVHIGAVGYRDSDITVYWTPAAREAGQVP